MGDLRLNTLRLIPIVIGADGPLPHAQPSLGHTDTPVMVLFGKSGEKGTFCARGKKEGVPGGREYRR